MDKNVRVSSKNKKKQMFEFQDYCSKNIIKNGTLSRSKIGLHADLYLNCTKKLDAVLVQLNC